MRGGEEEGEGAGVCLVSLVNVTAYVLDRLCTGAGVQSARVVSFSIGGPPMSVAVAG